MAQTDNTESLYIDQFKEKSGSDEAVSLSDSFANVLVIDMRLYRTVGVSLRLDDAAIDGDYQIFGSYKRDPDTSDVSGDEWTVEKVSTALAHEVNSNDVITKPYFKVVVQAKADSGTPTLKAWYRAIS